MDVIERGGRGEANRWRTESQNTSGKNNQLLLRWSEIREQGRSIASQLPKHVLYKYSSRIVLGYFN